MGSAAGYVELKLNLNVKLFYRPDSLINLPKDISEIDKFCVQLMRLNDHLLNYRNQLSQIHRLQHQTPNPMLILLDAIETLEDEFLKLKESTILESNERFVMDFSSAKRTGSQAMGIGINNNNNRNNQGFIDYFPHFHENNKKLDLTKTQGLLNLNNKEEIFQKRATMAPETRKVFGSGSGSGRALDVQPLRVHVSPTAAIGKRLRIKWTRNLHLKFCLAVDSLGGPEVAKPKPIKELMKIEGLTNEQVRSHLQKYRKQLENLAAGKGNEEEEEDYEAESVAECGGGGGGASHFFFNGYKYQPPFKWLNSNNLDDGDTFSSNYK